MSRRRNKAKKLNMAKTKKTILNENKKLKTKQYHNNKIKKNINLNCVVKLDNIDHLLHKYKINNDSNAHHKEINIGIRIKNNKLTIRDQSIPLEQHNDQFNFELRIKNDDVHLVKLQKVCDESVIKSPTPKSLASLQLQLDKKSMRQPGKLPRSKTVAELANDSWKRCKSHTKSKQLNLEVGQYVMSKMKSYSPCISLQDLLVSPKTVKRHTFTFTVHIIRGLWKLAISHYLKTQRKLFACILFVI